MVSTVSQAKPSVQLNKNELYSLKNLHSGKRSPLIKHNGRITVSMVFQPDCSWCKKQGKTFTTLMEKCSKIINLSLIGNKGERHQLKRELRHFDRNITAYQADHGFLREIGGIAASPTTLFFNSNGDLIGKKKRIYRAEKIGSSHQ